MVCVRACVCVRPCVCVCVSNAPVAGSSVGYSVAHCMQTAVGNVLQGIC